MEDVPDPFIDLHAHSSVSDGTERPADLVDAAAAAGLDGVALTDHDTTAGWDEATAAVRDRLLAEAAGNQYPVGVFQILARVLIVYILGVYPVYIDLGLKFEAGVSERLRDRKIRVVKRHVFSDKRDLYCMF